MSGTPPTADVRPLGPAERARLLARLGGPPPTRDAAGLARLKWRFLCALPFHNLDLLAGTSPRTVEACIAAVLAGRGGPCHVMATGFLALLRGLGFRAWLAEARIGAPGDHLVCVVDLDGRRWVCDVGNGHPYRAPFPLDGRVEIAHLGWRFEAEGDGQRLTLHRHLDDGRRKRVYVVDPAPRGFADFAGIIAAHHEAPGFGPFLTGLRAVRLGDDLVATLRDLRYCRYSALGPRARPVADLDAARRLLDRVFGLAGEATDAALARLAPAAAGWAPLPVRAPRVAVTVSATDRPRTLAALLDDLEAEWARTARKCAPSLVIVVENSREPAARAAHRARVAEGAGPLALRLVDDGLYGRSIADSRGAQTRALAAALAAGEAIDAVWMLDDDLRLAQLRLDGGVLRETRAIRYFDRLADAWNTRPEAALCVGRVCGDPPIPPDAVLACGLLDVAANLDRFAALDPAAPYPAPDGPAAFALPDYYYDHSRAGDAHLDTAFHWLPRREGATTREAAAACVRALAGVFAGRAPTRPLLDVGEAGAFGPSTLRGGHAVFLDVDAALRHPYPAVRLGDGVATRRADMVGATRLDRAGGSPVAYLPWPVLHAREGQRDGGLAALRGEFFGVLLARAEMDDGGRVDRARLAERAAARRRRITARLALARRRAVEAAAALTRARASWMGRDPAIAAALDALAAAMETCPSLARDPAEVDAALDAPADLERIARALEAPR